ncbi:MAG: type II toxin-antitoxin system VapC family toxin [Gammaproteobacteria bacterium]
MSYLLDTNVLSELVKTKPNENLLNWFSHIPDDCLYVSVLSIGEIRKGVEAVSDNMRKQKLKLWLEQELTTWFGTRMLGVNYAVADRWGRLQAQLKRSLPAIDSLIAATALHYDLCVVTRNEQDYKFQSLEVINPWKAS